jgi:2-polyprenyl-3-methyl-5-hydroxy-6-metoxy-1,4-benzoquinol methylase
MESDAAKWEQRYGEGDTPWDSGHPSSELMRVLAQERIQPCRAIELGCGTGTNSIWLAQQGFEVTGVDVSSLAIASAKKKAADSKISVRFVQGDVLNLPDLGQPFPFFFDRGCYHVVRRIDATGFVATLSRITTPDAIGLVLTGNAREPHDPGPPVVSEEEIRRELGQCFDIIHLQEFRFDSSPQLNEKFLGWSCLLRKKRMPRQSPSA